MLAGNAIFVNVETDDDSTAVALVEVALRIDEVLGDVVLSQGLAANGLGLRDLCFQLPS